MTAEPPVPFPISPYCRVRARVASIWPDGPDDGTHPDWRPATGEKVTLTPSIGSQLLTYDVAGPVPIIVTVERVECVVGADGWLTKNDGRPVYIAPTDDPLMSATGWTWTANIKGKSVVFAAPSGGEVDLALFIAAPAVDATKAWVERIPELVALIEAGSDPAVIAAIVEDYLAANPPVSDHGTLNGLDGDDHPQYALADGTRGEFAASTHEHTMADITDYMSAAMGVVHHTTADAPRPDYAAVYWTGELEPINALPGDIWRNA